jgi:hypothetical protein
LKIRGTSESSTSAATSSSPRTTSVRLLSEHRIPLVFLEACETAESVAPDLLKAGVASVVAMSHSVLVRPHDRFVEAFYAALGDGPGSASHARGQRTLKDDDFRGRIFGAGELRLEDWFVPVLFPGEGDPSLSAPSLRGRRRRISRRTCGHASARCPSQPQTGSLAAAGSCSRAAAAAQGKRATR